MCFGSQGSTRSDSSLVAAAKGKQTASKQTSQTSDAKDSDDDVVDDVTDEVKRMNVGDKLDNQPDTLEEEDSDDSSDDEVRASAFSTALREEDSSDDSSDEGASANPLSALI